MCVERRRRPRKAARQKQVTERGDCVCDSGHARRTSEGGTYVRLLVSTHAMSRGIIRAAQSMSMQPTRFRARVAEAFDPDDRRREPHGS